MAKFNGAKPTDNLPLENDLMENSNIEIDEDDDEHSSESDFDEPLWTANDEVGFLRALSAVKSRDPKIYDTDVNFYEPIDELLPSVSFSSKTMSTATTKATKRKADTEKMTLRDYERRLVTERGGRLSEDEDDAPMNGTNEHDDDDLLASKFDGDQRIRQEFKQLFNVDDDEEDGIELLTKRVKTEQEKKKEDDDYYEWLKSDGASALKILDEDLNKLKKRWSKREELDNEELFLRDYLLEKQYENEGDEEAEDETLPTYEEIVAQDAEEEKAELFEHKFNFRFQEPDQDFIKQYPRTITATLRDSKKRRRERILERKRAERELLKKIMSEPMSDEEDGDDEDSPFRFRYRSVPANDYGLSTAEILMADDKQLNAWVSTKRVCAYHSNEEEQRDIERFKRKSKNTVLKERIFRPPSPPPKKSPADAGEGETSTKKKKRKKKQSGVFAIGEKGKSKKHAAADATELGVERLRAYGVRTKRLKRRLNKLRMDAKKARRKAAHSIPTVNGMTNGIAES